jgi:predicted DNA-binding transcriptional regulator AlpA
MGTLLDTGQIAELLGVSREHVTNRLTKRSDFPRPVIDASRKMRRWSEADVMAWAGGDQSKRAAMSDADSR